MRHQSSLGRGLDALLGEQHPQPQPQADPSTPSLMQVPLSAIDANPEQPRKRFDQQALEELAQSIREHGVLQPVILRPGDQPGRYRLIAGERRFRASMLAEMGTIPAIVQQLAPREAMELALIENIQRRDLNPIETAHALKSLQEEFGQTQEQLAQRLGINRVTLTNTLRLNQLEEPLQQAIIDAGLSAGHARALLAAPAKHRQDLLQRTIDSGLSVRQVEQAAKLLSAPKKPTRAAQTPEDFVPLVDAVKKMTGMRTKVNGTLERGQITLTFKNREQLERFYQLFFEE